MEKLLLITLVLMMNVSKRRDQVAQKVCYCFVMNVKKEVIHYLDVYVNHLKIERAMHLVFVMKIEPF